MKKSLFIGFFAAVSLSMSAQSLSPEVLGRIQALQQPNPTDRAIHNALAAGDPIGVVNNLSDFIFGLIRAVGLILLGWGIVQVGLSFQSHDPSQRSNGFLTLAGGIIITFSKEILNLIVG